MTFLRLSFTLALVVLAAGDAGARCDDRLRTSSPTARFTINADGTATDTRTGLVWQRCPLGTALDDAGTPTFPGDDRCLPVAAAAQTFTWGVALLAAQDVNATGFAGFTDWRVPNRKELLSIVETRCTSPAINAQVFPDTPAEAFFSSTPYSSGEDHGARRQLRWPLRVAADEDVCGASPAGPLSGRRSPWAVPRRDPPRR